MRLAGVAKGLGILLLLPVLCGLTLIVVLGWRQPNELTLPAPTGPYAVGRLAFDWLDEGRIDPFAPAAGTKRELPAWVWYPAAADATEPVAMYMPSGVYEAMQPNPPAIMRFVMERLTTDRTRISSHALDSPPLAPGDEAFPVLILKAGLGAAVVQNAVLAEELASHGYVVVGSDSPHTTPGTAYLDGRVVMRSAAGHPPETEPGRVSDLAPGQPNDLYLPVVAALVEDNRFVMSRLAALAEEDPEGRFTGRLDLEALGAIGHSIGGAAAIQFCHEYEGCRAGVDLDGMPIGEVVRGGIGKPFLFILADRPIFHAPKAELDPAAGALLSALDRMRARDPARPSLLLFSGSQHFNFFDQAILTQPTLWRIFGAIGSTDQTRALQTTRRYVRAFFDTYLKGHRDPLLEGPSAEFPEVLFQ